MNCGWVYRANTPSKASSTTAHSTARCQGRSTGVLEVVEVLITGNYAVVATGWRCKAASRMGKLTKAAKMPSAIEMYHTMS